MRMSFRRSTCLLPLLILPLLSAARAQQPVLLPSSNGTSAQSTAWDLGTEQTLQPVSCDGCGQCASDCCCSGGLFAGGEYLYIRTHFSEAVAFATVNDAITPTGLRRSV